VTLSLHDIVQALGGELHGSPDFVVQRLAPLQSAQDADLSFLSHPQYAAQLQTTRAGCVIVAPAMLDTARARGACIVTDEPYLYFARVTQLYRRVLRGTPKPGVHPSAVVDATAMVHPSASVGALCVVERGAHIGAGTVLKARVIVGEDCAVGERCILHSGVVIGADGFGFAPDKANGGAWEKIEQLGAVRIGNDVEIGANTCIDRGAMDDTIIEDGVKLDNLIQIGHNVRIGKHTAMAGCVGVAGSATVGAHCTVGGGAIILGHLVVGDHVHISAASVVTRSISKPGQYTGMFPIDDNANWEKNAASLKQLYSLRERIKHIEKNI
jgi:UDP-3-O-[3-hydroxymyristoyl] glucosamine N-acyltransferase